MATRKKTPSQPEAIKVPAKRAAKTPAKTVATAAKTRTKATAKTAAKRAAPNPASTVATRAGAPHTADTAVQRLRLPRATPQSTALPDYDPAAQFDHIPALRRSRYPRTASRSLTAWPVVPGLPPDFFAGHTGAPLTEAAFEQAAQQLGCEVAAVKAVAEVESRGAPFDAQSRPTILYERHVFARCCRPAGCFNASHPDLSARGGYGPGGYGGREQQWKRLAQAYALDPDAALKAASWGLFQILGENHRACGHATAAGFVRAMTVSQVEHLQAFVHFVASHRLRLQALRTLDWASFARYYNGPAYAQYSYDTKMAAAYARHRRSGPLTPSAPAPAPQHPQTPATPATPATLAPPAPPATPTQLSRYFSLRELTHSNTAVARGIPNQPGPAELPRLQALCQSVLDPLREALGRPLRVTSGYRSPALNAVIPGSSPTSQHSRAEAADLQCPGMNTATLFKTLIRLGLPFDQLIYEAKSASSIWVHVSHRASGNRGQMLIAHFAANGRVSYSAVTREAALAIPEATRSLMAEPELTYEEVADEPRPRASRAPRKTAAKPAAKTAVKAAKKAPARTRSAKPSAQP